MFRGGWLNFSSKASKVDSKVTKLGTKCLGTQEVARHLQMNTFTAARSHCIRYWDAVNLETHINNRAATASMSNEMSE